MVGPAIAFIPPRSLSFRYGVRHTKRAACGSALIAHGCSCLLLMAVDTMRLELSGPSLESLDANLLLESGPENSKRMVGGSELRLASV